MSHLRAPAAAAGATLAALMLAGCGSSDAGSADPREPASTPTQIRITVSGSKVTPEPGTVAVKAGRTVELTVTSDKDDEVHVHGIDKELEVKAGVAGTLSFTATPTGVYEVETHKSGTLLFKLQVDPS